MGIMELEMSGMQPHAVAVASPFTRAFRAMSNVAPLAPPPSRFFTCGCKLFPIARIEMLALLHHDPPPCGSDPFSSVSIRDKSSCSNP